MKRRHRREGLGLGLWEQAGGGGCLQPPRRPVDPGCPEDPGAPWTQASPEDPGQPREPRPLTNPGQLRTEVTHEPRAPHEPMPSCELRPPCEPRALPRVSLKPEKQAAPWTKVRALARTSPCESPGGKHGCIPSNPASLTLLTCKCSILDSLFRSISFCLSISISKLHIWLCKLCMLLFFSTLSFCSKET